MPAPPLIERMFALNIPFWSQNEENETSPDAQTQQHATAQLYRNNRTFFQEKCWLLMCDYKTSELYQCQWKKWDFCCPPPPKFSCASLFLTVIIVVEPHRKKVEEVPRRQSRPKHHHPKPTRKTLTFLVPWSKISCCIHHLSFLRYLMHPKLWSLFCSFGVRKKKHLVNERWRRRNCDLKKEDVIFSSLPRQCRRTRKNR